MKNNIFRIVSLFFILLCPSFLYAGKDKVITIVPASRADSNAPITRTAPTTEGEDFYYQYYLHMNTGIYL